MLNQVVRLQLSPKLSDEEKKAVLEAQQEILTGYPIFSGKIVAQQGKVRCQENMALTSKALGKPCYPSSMIFWTFPKSNRGRWKSCRQVIA